MCVDETGSPESFITLACKEWSG